MQYESYLKTPKEVIISFFILKNIPAAETDSVELHSTCSHAENEIQC